jgi:hypothetical protein
MTLILCLIMYLLGYWLGHRKGYDRGFNRGWDNGGWFGYLNGKSGKGPLLPREPDAEFVRWFLGGA